MLCKLANNFRERVPPQDLPELMDGDCSYADFRDCLLSLEQVNRWLLGYRPTLAWLRTLPFEGAVHIVDVGCGAGDLLRRIEHWARDRRITVELTGIDFNPYATRSARELAPPKSDIAWVTGNALTYQPDMPIDIIVSSLMTHHLEDGQIITLLRWMEKTARVGCFINDLERSKLSCEVFGWPAKILGWHRFVKHDGPVSFRRALSEADGERLLAEAEIERSTVTVQRWRPGRLCVGRASRC